MNACLWLDFHYSLSLEKQLISQLSSFMYNWISPFQCMFLGSARDLQRVYQQHLGLLPIDSLLLGIPAFISNTSSCSESYPVFHHMDWKLHIKLIHLCHLLPACACMLSCSIISDSLGPHGLQPARHFCPWNFPCKNTGVGCHFHFLRICIEKYLSILQALTPLQNLLMKSNLRSDSPPHNTQGEMHGLCTPGGRNITQGHLRFLLATNFYMKSEVNLLNFIIRIPLHYQEQVIFLSPCYLR